MKKIIALLLTRNGWEMAGYAIIIASLAIGISAFFCETEELATAVITGALAIAYGGVCLAEKGVRTRVLAELNREERKARMAAAEAEKQNAAAREQIIELLTKMSSEEKKEGIPSAKPVSRDAEAKGRA